jgi:hypothetical protein
MTQAASSQHLAFIDPSQLRFLGSGQSDPMNAPEPPSQSSLVPYQTEDGQTRIDSE